jgi:biopolymer transport protein TolQ
MPSTSGPNLNILSLIANAGAMVQLVLAVLLFGSVLCWAIIFWKSRTLSRARAGNRRFMETFGQGLSLEEMYGRLNLLPPSPIATVFRAAAREVRNLPWPVRGPLSPELLDNVSRTVSRTAALEVAEMEKQVGWLATAANASPFIGLFGTVWGIMGSFQGISTHGSASLAVVAPGISEALIATAAGLAAAIPAVIAYNHFVAQIRRLAIDLEGFSQELLNALQRHAINAARE